MCNWNQILTYDLKHNVPGNVPFATSSNEIVQLLNKGKSATFIDNFNTECNLNVEFFRDVEEVLGNEVNNNEISDTEQNTCSPKCPYLSLDELNLNYKHVNYEFAILHLNIASLKSHHEELDTLVKNCEVNFDIIGITETGLNELNKNSTKNTKLEGFTQEDTFTETPRGGTRLYISEGLNYLPRDDLHLYKKGHVESTCIEILSTGKPNTIVMCLYRHPHMDLREFNTMYDDLLSKIQRENKQIYIMGDFNIDLLKSHINNDADTFLQQNLSSNLKPLIVRPTRLTPTSKTLIDNIFTNYHEDNVLSGNLICSLSDHLPQFTIINKNKDEGKPKKSSKKVKDFRKFNLEKFKEQLQHINWQNLFVNKDPHQTVQLFINKINELIDTCTPTKLIKIIPKKSHKPWITQGILKSVTTKNKLYKKFCRAKTPVIKAQRFSEFKKYKNKLTKVMRDSKTYYLRNFFSENRDNLQKVWQGIRDIIGSKKTSLLPKVLIHDKKQHKNDENIANIFNNFYGTIAEKK